MIKKSVLIVEDEQIIASDLKMTLEYLGYDVTDIADSGEYAISVSGKERPDIVLMDIVIRGEMDGIDAAKEIRSRFNIPVIYVTAYADRDFMERAKITEPFAYLIKPVDEKELRNTIELALYRKEVEDKLKRLATTDSLTQAYNRTLFDEIMGREMERVSRYGQTLSIIIFDLDNFKCVNDSFGHISGDKVLREMADIVRGNIRGVDYLVRWGGEEFLIILPETDLDGAAMLSERIRAVIQDHSFEGVGTVTVSLGVTAVRAEDTVDTLIKRADEALYMAKGGGRNRVVTSP